MALQSFNLQRVDNGYIATIQCDDDGDDQHLVFHSPENVLDVLADVLLTDVEEEDEDDDDCDDECCGICQTDDFITFLNALIRG